MGRQRGHCLPRLPDWSRRLEHLAVQLRVFGIQEQLLACGLNRKSRVSWANSRSVTHCMLTGGLSAPACFVPGPRPITPFSSAKTASGAVFRQ